MSKKSSSSYQLHTNIESYVRAKYPDFAALLDYCKLFHLTMPRQGSAGVTLIIPHSKYLDEIRALSFSADASSVADACTALLSLMMRKAIPSASAWSSEDITDMRYPSQQITADVNGNTVKLVIVGVPYATL